MNDKEIQRYLKDASLYFAEAAKQWIRYKDIARSSFKGGMAMLDKVYDYVERPMGGEEEE